MSKTRTQHDLTTYSGIIAYLQNTLSLKEAQYSYQDKRPALTNNGYWITAPSFKYDVVKEFYTPKRKDGSIVLDDNGKPLKLRNKAFNTLPYRFFIGLDRIGGSVERRVKYTRALIASLKGAGVKVLHAGSDTFGSGVVAVHLRRKARGLVRTGWNEKVYTDTNGVKFECQKHSETLFMYRGESVDRIFIKYQPCGRPINHYFVCGYRFNSKFAAFKFIDKAIGIIGTGIMDYDGLPIILDKLGFDQIVTPEEAKEYARRMLKSAKKIEAGQIEYRGYTFSIEQFVSSRVGGNKSKRIKWISVINGIRLRGRTQAVQVIDTAIELGGIELVPLRKVNGMQVLDIEALNRVRKDIENTKSAPNRRAPMLRWRMPLRATA